MTTNNAVFQHLRSIATPPGVKPDNNSLPDLTRALDDLAGLGESAPRAALIRAIEDVATAHAAVVSDHDRAISEPQDREMRARIAEGFRTRVFRTCGIPDVAPDIIQPAVPLVGAPYPGRSGVRIEAGAGDMLVLRESCPACDGTVDSLPVTRMADFGAWLGGGHREEHVHTFAPGSEHPNAPQPKALPEALTDVIARIGALAAAHTAASSNTHPCAPLVALESSARAYSQAAASGRSAGAQAALIDAAAACVIGAAALDATGEAAATAAAITTAASPAVDVQRADRAVAVSAACFAHALDHTQTVGRAWEDARP